MTATAPTAEDLKNLKDAADRAQADLDAITSGDPREDAAIVARNAAAHTYGVAVTAYEAAQRRAPVAHLPVHVQDEILAMARRMRTSISEALAMYTQGERG
jgi:hypothetical protein